jgi:hypothetical protein
MLKHNSLLSVTDLISVEKLLSVNLQNSHSVMLKELEEEYQNLRSPIVPRD